MIWSTLQVAIAVTHATFHNQLGLQCPVCAHWDHAEARGGHMTHYTMGSVKRKWNTCGHKMLFVSTAKETSRSILRTHQRVKVQQHAGVGKEQDTRSMLGTCPAVYDQPLTTSPHPLTTFSLRPGSWLTRLLFDSKLEHSAILSSIPALVGIEGKGREGCAPVHTCS